MYPVYILNMYLFGLIMFHTLNVTYNLAVLFIPLKYDINKS